MTVVKREKGYDNLFDWQCLFWWNIISAHFYVILYFKILNLNFKLLQSDNFFLIQNISKKNLRKVVVMNVYVDIFNENENKMKWMWILYEVEIVGQIRSIR